MTIVVESTSGCLRSKLLLLILEERPDGAAPYQTVRRSAGYFTERGQRIGPWVRWNGQLYQEFNVAVRALCQAADWWPLDAAEAVAVDSWLEHLATWLRPAAVALHHASQRGQEAPDAQAILERSLGCLESRLREHPTLAAEFSPADACLWFLSALRAAGADLSGTPAVCAALERLEARPALVRALEHFNRLNQQPVSEEQ